MNLRITAIGEVLWDLLPEGRQLGGAPANFACHARSLGADATLISRVGQDDLGREVLARFAAKGFPPETIQQDNNAPTGTVSVEVDAGGQPKYTIHADVAWDHLQADESAGQAVAKADAICFGSLGQRSALARSSIQTLVKSARPETLRVFDVNLRPPFWTREVVEQSIRLADVLKLNDQELPILAGLFGISGDEREQVTGLAGRFHLKLVALTRGAGGSLLLAEERWSEHPGFPVTVRDAVGAGDSFTATLVVGWLRHHDLDDINRMANEVAAYVCTQPGATPDLPERLTARFQTS
ncbi:carbohydrate kinase family protein [Zavarzinella formosa]|uniref:carbohydrate kinase family protein n=1 Tax=Zavarzinella formosa TaxID=360055 RepID=UPI0002D99D2B|nr:carbohydrate kinase [Zavarzinella formosa]